MSTTVVAVVLGSAVLHAFWNTLAHTAKDRLTAVALIALATAGASALLLPFLRPPAHGVRPWILASSVLQALYYFGLVLAYRLGDFGRMYPLARGTSPLVVALAATFAVGQPMSGLEAAGVAVVSAGLLALAFSDGIPGRADLPAVGAAVGTGLLIASYTVVDGVAVRRSGSVLGYSCWTFLLSGVLALTAVAVLRRGRLRADLRQDTARGLTGGLVSMTAYTLVLWAQTRGGLAEVATVRESSILIGAAVGALVLKEGFGRVRVAASAGVVVGILLIAR